LEGLRPSKPPCQNDRAGKEQQNVSVDIPTGILTVVTGVAGTGKSSLIHRGFLRRHPGAIVIDQSLVGISSRSNPATYTGIMSDIRHLLAIIDRLVDKKRGLGRQCLPKPLIA
jgi:excinuclease UvrABC ATPase subunit